jgi:branched-chain amino acid aminotransferase
MSGWGVFSTIRVLDGTLFAYDRHYARMKKDAEALRVPFPPDPGYIEQRLLRLIRANGARNASLRVIIVRNGGGIWEGPAIAREFDLVAFTTDLNNWGDGVRLRVVQNARFAANPFSGAKILSWAQNLVWYEEAHERGYDEAILLNERGEVAECTSANIFAARGSEVWTPPLTSGCLPGITREVLLGEITVPGITIGERDMKLADLEKADEVFITSTTRSLLPVHEIEGLHIRRGTEIVLRLNRAFSEYVDRYVAASAEA